MIKRVFLHSVLLFSSVFSMVLGSVPIPESKTNNSSILFLENKGQWIDSLKFKAELADGILYFLPNKLIFDFTDQEDLHHLSSHGHQHDTLAPEWDGILNSHVISIDFFPNGNPKIEGSNPTVTKYNYIRGNDPKQWGVGVRAYQEINYQELYPGIDLEIKKGIQNLKYEYHLKPHAQASDIQMKYNGTDDLKVVNHQLFVKTSVNEWYEQRPYAYQIINGKKRTVKCDFHLHDNTVSFSLGHYNKNYELVIDPELIFSTSSGSFSDNWGNTACFDDDGNLYSGGTVWSHVGGCRSTSNDCNWNDTGFPTTVGAFQADFSGDLGDQDNRYVTDMGILKFDSLGTELLFATYLGGNDSDVPTSMIITPSGDLAILGITGSLDFPAAVNTFNGGLPDQPNTLHNFKNGTDLIITLLDGTDGSAVSNSRYMGGSDNDGFMKEVLLVNDGSNSFFTKNPLVNNYGDQFRGDINVDRDGNIYCGSVTASTDFNQINGFQTTHAGFSYDGIAFKLSNDLSNVIWNTYLGGANNDAIFGIQLDSLNNLFVTGGTSSRYITSTFPTTNEAVYPNSLGDTDGFISLISNDGSSLISSSYVGTNQHDQSYFVQLDEAQNVYLLGQTKGQIPITANATSVTNGGQFIQKWTYELDSIEFSSTFGSNNTNPSNIIPNISPTAFLVNDCGNIFVSGWGGRVNGSFTYSSDSRFLYNNYPSSQIGSYTSVRINYNGGFTQGMYTSSDAYQTTSTGSDFYVYVLSADATTPLFGSYFGGRTSVEHVDGGTSRFSKKGVIYQSVCANCGGNDDFPTYPDDNDQNTYPKNNEAENCNNGVFKYDLANLKAAIEEVNSCIDHETLFTNISLGGTDFVWEFGDGNGTFTVDPTSVSHTYEESGTYLVRLIASDITTCIGKDTAEI